MARKTSGRRNPGSYNSQIKKLQNTLTILTTMLYYTNTEKKKEMLLRKTSSRRQVCAYVRICINKLARKA